MNVQRRTDCKAQIFPIDAENGCIYNCSFKLVTSLECLSKDGANPDCSADVSPARGSHGVRTCLRCH